MHVLIVESQRLKVELAMVHQESRTIILQLLSMAELIVTTQVLLLKSVMTVKPHLLKLELVMDLRELLLII
jgi:hypothetical protein